jgi:hypothetical protein
MSNPNPPAAAACHPRTVVWIGCLALALYGGFLSYHTTVVAGGADSSGYLNSAKLFAFSYGPATLLHFAKWLALLLPAAVLVLPALTLTRGGERRREVTALALGFSAITGCYLFYEVSHEVWWCLRFILPAVPLLILGALWGVEALALARTAGRPIFALLFDSEEKDAFQRCGGEWTRVTQVRNVALWQLAAPAP